MKAGDVGFGAKSPGEDMKYEKATNPCLFETVHEGNIHVPWGAPTSEVLFQLQSHEIKRIAAKEDCIFIGRYADHVLKASDAAILSTFFSAPVEQRVQRKMEQKGLSRFRAKQAVHNKNPLRGSRESNAVGKSFRAP